MARFEGIDFYDLDSLFTEEERMIRDTVRAFVEDRVMPIIGEAYIERKFPKQLIPELGELGVYGANLPEKYGCAGLNNVSYGLIMQELERGDSGLRSFASVQGSLCMYPIHAYGSEEQKQRWLPPLIRGETKSCFGVTEADAGLDTTSIATTARRPDEGYEIHGKKVWTSTAQEADKIMLLARTTPKEECERHTDGMTLFYTDLDRDYCDVTTIPKMSRASVDSCEVFVDGLPVPAEDRVGEEGQGFACLLHSLNPERILIAAEAIGIGRNALARATEYAKTRVVFDRPIGQNQAIQHPLAQSWMELEAAWMMTMRAASLYDSGEPCGLEANAAKYLAGEAGFQACTRAVMTHGGMGYAKDQWSAKPLVTMETDDIVAIASEEVALRTVFSDEIDRMEPQENEVMTWSV